MKLGLEFSKGYWHERRDLPPLWVPPMWRMTIPGLYIVLPLAAKQAASIPIDENKFNQYAKEHKPTLPEIRKYLHDWVDKLPIESYHE